MENILSFVSPSIVIASIGFDTALRKTEMIPDKFIPLLLLVFGAIAGFFGISPNFIGMARGIVSASTAFHGTAIFPGFKE